MKKIVIFFLSMLTACFIYSVESVFINYVDDAQSEIIYGDVRILIDTEFPIKLSAGKVYSEEVLLTTHHDSDHINSDFMKSFKGKQIDFTEADIKGKNYTIKSIPSYHDELDRLRMGNPTNYLFVIEIAGLRIAHFGDIGVDALSPDELKKIGKIDILFSQLSNSYSHMDNTNEKGFNLVKQINPKILIPTHSKIDTTGKGAKMWNGKYSEKELLEISKDKLPENTTMIIMGSMSKSFAKMFNLEKF